MTNVYEWKRLRHRQKFGIGLSKKKNTELGMNETCFMHRFSQVPAFLFKMSLGVEI